MKFSKDHEWVKLDGDLAIVGITDYAAEQLGDVTYVELPDVGATLTKDATFGTIESVKTVSDLCSPMSGEVTEVNTELEDEPAIVNEDPFNKGWILKMKVSNAAEYEELLDEAGYKAVCN